MFSLGLRFLYEIYSPYTMSLYPRCVRSSLQFVVIVNRFISYFLTWRTDVYMNREMYHVIVYISLRYFPVVLIEPLERNESTRFFEHIRELFFGINFAKSFILYYNIKINCLRARVVHYIFVYYLSVLVVRNTISIAPTWNLYVSDYYNIMCTVHTVYNYKLYKSFKSI